VLPNTLRVFTTFRARIRGCWIEPIFSHYRPLCTGVNKRAVLASPRTYPPNLRSYHTRSRLHFASLNPLQAQFTKPDEKPDDLQVTGDFSPAEDSTSAEMAGPSKKRKLNEEALPKLYAVKAGHRTGVFKTWDDCQQNITGYKGAVCMSNS